VFRGSGFRSALGSSSAIPPAVVVFVLRFLSFCVFSSFFFLGVRGCLKGEPNPQPLGTARRRCGEPELTIGARCRER